MEAGLAFFCLVVLHGVFGNVQAANNTIQCRYCSYATTLSDCNRLVACDSTLEDCYMDELITDALTIVYEGGCRSKQVCANAGKKRSSPLIACSRCCNNENDCNRRLCGIKDDTLTAGQCYSCDHERYSEQSSVQNPSQCVTLTTCQSNEVCYVSQSDIAGRNTFYYGCRSKLMCEVLMKQAFQDYQVCVANTTQPPPGMTWLNTCGNFRRATSLCHSCCADFACNYGTCHDLNDRIFKLAMQGKFDMKTLKAV